MEVGEELKERYIFQRERDSIRITFKCSEDGRWKSKLVMRSGENEVGAVRSSDQLYNFL